MKKLKKERQAGIQGRRTGNRKQQEQRALPESEYKSQGEGWRLRERTEPEEPKNQSLSLFLFPNRHLKQ